MTTYEQKIAKLEQAKVLISGLTYDLPSSVFKQMNNWIHDTIDDALDYDFDSTTYEERMHITELAKELIRTKIKDTF